MLDRSMVQSNYKNFRKAFPNQWVAVYGGSIYETALTQDGLERKLPSNIRDFILVNTSATDGNYALIVNKRIVVE